MKNIFFTILTTVSVFIITGGVANGQALKNIDTVSSNEKNISLRDERNNVVDSGFQFFNEIHLRAVREFMKEYDDVHNARWYKYKKGYVATFERDSSVTRLYYNKRGEFEVQLRYFTENRLSPEVRGQVKNRYSDYEIFQVCEVSGFGKIFYQIKIRDDNNCKVINIINGEIKVVVKYTDTALR